MIAVVCRMRIEKILAVAAFFTSICSPLGAQIYVEDGLTYEHELQLSGAVNGTFAIGNAGGKPQEVKIYQNDYFFNAEGEKSYLEMGSLERSNARWITFFPSRFIVPANDKTVVTYEIEAPPGESLVGTYWSMLMVEPIPESSPEASGNRNEDEVVAVRQVLRYALQIVTHIGGTGTRQLKVVHASLYKEDDAVELHIDVENTGERWLRPQLTADVFASDGAKLPGIVGRRRRLYPGTSVRFSVDLSTLGTGTFKVLVILDAGGEDVFGASYSIQLGP